MEGSCSNVRLVWFLRSVYLKSSSTGSECSLFDKVLISEYTKIQEVCLAAMVIFMASK